jgi:hypothetical protein
VALQNRWLSNVNLKTSDNDLNGNTQNFVDSSLDAYDVVDTTISKRFEFGDSSVEAYLTVNNLLDERVPAVPVQLGTSGLVLSDAGLLRRHGPVLHPGVPHKVLNVNSGIGTTQSRPDPASSVFIVAIVHRLCSMTSDAARIFHHRHERGRVKVRIVTAACHARCQLLSRFSPLFGRPGPSGGTAT